MDAEKRQSWLDEICQLEKLIDWVEGGGIIMNHGEDIHEATLVWLAKVEKWKAELEDLLIQFPEPTDYSRTDYPTS